MLSVTVHSPVSSYSDFQASCNAKPKSTERHLHTQNVLSLCSHIHTMGDDQRLKTVHEGDALRFLCRGRSYGGIL